MQIGDINVVNSLLDSELRIGVMEKLLDFLLNKNMNLIKPTQEQIEQWRIDTVTKLQSKYPNSGITFNRN